MSDIQHQLETSLSQSSVHCIRQLLGDAIRQRITSATDPSCSILFLLTNNVSRVLEHWERMCADYLSAVVSVEEAAQKAAEDLRRVRRASAGEFNAALGDFLGEMSLVGALAKRGYSDFIPVPTATRKTFDYKCKKNGQDACLECKNIRAPITVFDAFNRLMAAKRAIHPTLRGMRLVITTYSDNSVTDLQEAAIDTFLTALGTGKPVQPLLVLPGDVAVEVKVFEGDGTVMMLRSMGVGEMTPYVDQAKFMAKVTTVVRSGVAQLRTCDGLAILGMNVMSPDATIPTEWLGAMREIVRDSSGGNVQCELTFQHGYIAPE